MLAGPDLLVILVIALIVFGPKKLPELAKIIGRALGEFKKTTEEMKESIGMKDLEEMRSNLTGMDLLTDLAEKTSKYMALSDSTKDTSLPKKESVSNKAISLTSVSVGNGKDGWQDNHERRHKKDVLGQKVNERGRETVTAKSNTGASAKLFGSREKNGPRFGEVSQGC